MKHDQAEKDKLTYEANRAKLREQIDVIQKRVSLAEADIDRAQFELDHINNLPPIVEPSALEEIERVQHLCSDEPYISSRKQES